MKKKITIASAIIFFSFLIVAVETDNNSINQILNKSTNLSGYKEANTVSEQNGTLVIDNKQDKNKTDKKPTK